MNYHHLFLILVPKLRLTTIIRLIGWNREFDQMSKRVIVARYTPEELRVIGRLVPIGLKVFSETKNDTTTKKRSRKGRRDNH